MQPLTPVQIVGTIEEGGNIPATPVAIVGVEPITNKPYELIDTIEIEEDTTDVNINIDASKKSIIIKFEHEAGVSSATLYSLIKENLTIGQVPLNSGINGELFIIENNHGLLLAKTFPYSTGNTLTYERINTRGFNMYDYPNEDYSITIKSNVENGIKDGTTIKILAY